jgi:hypothetical protein
MVDSPRTSEFDATKVRKALAKWWELEKQEAADLATDAPPPKRPVSVMTPIIEIDSHRAVRALLVAEEIVGFDIPPRTVKMGGYTSFDEMSDHLVSELEKIFVSKKEKADA